MKGYVTASGYMGYVENEYILFAKCFIRISPLLLTVQH